MLCGGNSYGKTKLILVFDKGLNRMLMCKRSKAPYQGLLNLAGGKVEPKEDSVTAAHRELEEETSISREDIVLTHLMDLTYYLHGRILEVYVGRLKSDISVFGSENKLFWLPIQDYRTCSEWLAGDDNVEHIIEYTLQLIETKKLHL